MKILVIGGTGSLGKTLVKRLHKKYPEIIKDNNLDLWVFSRDEAKQFHLRNETWLEFGKYSVGFILGDIRRYEDVVKALRIVQPDIIINCAALKQVPACEFQPEQAIMTNILGPLNLINACNEVLLNENKERQIKVLSVSTDKSVKSVNAYGATKFLQEKVHLVCGLTNTPVTISGATKTKIVANVVRYGNVLESEGSVIPFFKKLNNAGKALPITSKDMTRFLLSLDEAADLIFTALEDEEGGKIFIPNVRSSKIVDIAEVLLEEHYQETYVENFGWIETKIRDGEKIHEILLSEEETRRTYKLNESVYVIDQLKRKEAEKNLTEEMFSSGFYKNLMSKEELRKFLKEKHVI